MLKIHLLGGLNLFHDQSRYPFSSLPKVSPLLAHLLLQRQPIHRDRLAFALWPEVGEATARGNLRRHLYELNRALPSTAANNPWVRREGHDVQWNPLTPFWLDVSAFEELVQAGRLTEAVRQYQGRLLPLVDEGWLQPERERLHNLFLLSLQRLIDEQRRQQHYAEALLFTQRLLHYDPLHETGQRQVMLFRYALGDRAGAIQTYQQFADLLERELDVPPMPETKSLRDRILANTAPAVLLAEADDQTASTLTIPPTVSSKPRHQLPQPMRPLIGRETELAHLVHLLVTKQRRLVTITGPSGIGKSRLAVAVAQTLAQEHAHEYPDGLIFVPLAELSEPSQVFTAVNTHLGNRSQTADTTIGALVETLRYKRLLLLLDNFEHLLPAAADLAVLLQAVPGLSVLVTSQSLLHLYGEQAFALSGLKLPPLSSTANLASYEAEAVTFFTETAQVANPHFRLSHENGGAIAHICHRLDGLPLALELAAARSGLLSPADILTQLEDMLAFLSTPTRNVPTRHRSMEAALTWSYNLLTEAEQSLFASLAVFSGRFDLAAAAAVNGLEKGQTAVLLDLLRAKNLIRVADNPAAEMSLDLLFTIRAFAQAQLTEQGLEAAARDRHAAYFAGLCRFSSSDPAFNVGAHLARLVAVQADLLTAVSWLYTPTTPAEQQQTQLGWLLRILPQLYFRYGRVQEGVVWLNQVETSVERLALSEQPAILSQFTALVCEHGEYERAATYLTRALVVSKHLEDPYLIARVMLHQGILAGIREDYEQAVALSAQAIALDAGLRSGPMTVEKAHWWQNRALDLKYLERYAEALALLEEARAFLEDQADQMSLAGILHTMGGVYLAQAAHREAGRYYQLALDTAVVANYTRLIWLSLCGLAQVAAETSEWAKAVRLYSQANQFAITLGFSPIPVARRQEQDYLAQARQTLSPAAYREAWETSEQSFENPFLQPA